MVKLLKSMTWIPPKYNQQNSKNMKTLPKYLYFKDGIPTQTDFNTNQNIEVEDLLDFIKKSATKPEFKTLYGNIEDKLKQQNLALKTT